MFFKPRNRNNRAWTLVEMMVAVGVFSIGGVALTSFFVFGLRSFAAMSNYAVLDKANRQAMDKLTCEIRQARQVTNFTTNPPTLSLLSGDGLTVIYTFNPNTQQMVRDASDGSHQVLLTNCSLLNFDLRQRNPSNGVWGIFPPAQNQWQATVKAVELTWKTSMTISPTAAVNSENVQTARIIIRKQQDH
jgi:Tfp pilus assembly protein PilW